MRQIQHLFGRVSTGEYTPPPQPQAPPDVLPTLFSCHAHVGEGVLSDHPPRRFFIFSHEMVMIGFCRGEFRVRLGVWEVALKIKVPDGVL